MTERTLTCIVQKFGGTSVATLRRIMHVAKIVAATKETGNDVVVVVSAMAGETNEFIKYVNSLGGHEGDLEYERVVSSGEMITAGLLAIALKKLGIKAKSYAAWQVPIVTDNNFGQASIKYIEPQKLQNNLSQGIVPVICGFQGVTESGDMTTLGRGGSDFTAVAVAAALSADLCEIYSDVNGVYTADPALYPAATLLDKLNYDEMLEMAKQGAKVLQEKSVAYAKEKNVVIRVASSFTNQPGTIISGDSKPKEICGFSVVNIVYLSVTYKFPPDCSYEIMQILANHSIYTRLITSNVNSLTLAVDGKKVALAKGILKKIPAVSVVKQKWGTQPLSGISIIGRGVDDKKVVSALEQNGIEVVNYYKESTRLDLIVVNSKVKRALLFLHEICGLDQ